MTRQSARHTPLTLSLSLSHLPFQAASNFDIPPPLPFQAASDFDAARDFLMTTEGPSSPTVTKLSGLAKVITLQPNPRP